MEPPVATPASLLSPLERLPPELLCKVFDEIPYDYTARRDLVQGVSPTLAPFVQRLLFRELQIYAPGALPRLVAVVNAKPELGSYIISLKVWSEPSEIDTRELVDFSRHASQIQQMDLAPANPITRFILSSNTHCDSFPSLVNLKMSPFPSPTNSFAQQFRHLARCSKLNRLTIGIEEEDEGLVEQGAGGTEVGVTRGGVDGAGEGGTVSGERTDDYSLITATILELEGRLDHPELVKLGGMFAALKKVSLQGPYKTAVDFCPILNAINPIALVELELRDFVEEPSTTPIDIAITRFTALESLTLIGRFYTSLFYTKILSLHSLVSIFFWFPSSPSYDDLTMLIARKPSSLKRIELNQVYAQRAPSNWEGYEGYGADDEIVPHPSWEPPYWADNLTRAQVDDLIIQAKEADVSLGEDFLEAVEIDDDYAKELELCEQLQEERDDELMYGNGDTDPEENDWTEDEDGESDFSG